VGGTLGVAGGELGEPLAFGLVDQWHLEVGLRPVE
jgi:hypothetical protein